MKNHSQDDNGAEKLVVWSELLPYPIQQQGEVSEKRRVSTVIVQHLLAPSHQATTQFK